MKLSKRLNDLLRDSRLGLWKFFTSIRLAIILISLIALVALVGTLLPQAPFVRTIDYIVRYGPERFQMIRTLQFDHIYSSWYFMALLGLFSINMLACTFKRLKASLSYYRLPMRAKPPETLQQMQNHVRFAAPASPTEATVVREQVKQVLRAHKFEVRDSMAGTENQLLSTKWRWERFGIDVFHISLLVLLLGGILTAFLSFRTVQTAHKGETFLLPQADFSVRVNDFWSENYNNSDRVMDWHSRLTILKDNKEMLTKTIAVNSPLNYGGVKLFQAAMGEDWEAAELTIKVDRVQDNQSLGEFSVKINDIFHIPQEHLFVKASAFLPDFEMTKDQIIYNRSERLVNPAAYLEIVDNQGKSIMQMWTFSRPDVRQWYGSDVPYRFHLVGFHAPQSTTLEIKQDFGLPIVYIGYILLIGGLLVHIFFKHQQVWVHFGPKEIIVAGMARNNPPSFALDFARLVKEIEQSFVDHKSRSQINPTMAITN